MGTITMENFKYIKWNFPNIACLTQDNLPGEVQLVFVYATVGNPSLGVPILYPTLAGNRIYDIVYMNDIKTSLFLIP